VKVVRVKVVAVIAVAEMVEIETEVVAQGGVAAGIAKVAVVGDWRNED